MKSILLIGLGLFGRCVAEKLSALKHEVMAVDRLEKRVDMVLPFVTNAQIGDSTDKEFLQSLGVDGYDVCIVAIGDDFKSSLETTALLKDLGAKYVVARASNDFHERFLRRIDADEIVYPERQLAYWTAMRYSSDHILDYIELDDDHSIFEVQLPELWQGKTIGQLDVRRTYNINILGIKENGELKLNINPDTTFKKEQTLLVLGTNKNVQKCFKI